MFETDRLPSGWSSRLNHLDYVFVPTSFHSQIFSEAGIDSSKLRIWGEGVDTNWFDPSLLLPSPLPPSSPPSFTFISVFKFEERKNWKLLVRAFLAEFLSDPTIKLIILTSSYHSSTTPQETLDAFLESYFLSTNIAPPPDIPISLLSDLNKIQLRQLFRDADAFVLPTRGEGWGRPIVEAMSMGLPVIVTNFSGPTAFLTDDNSYMLTVNELVEVESGAFKGHKWADVSEPELRAKLRMCYADPTERKRRGDEARRTMSENFDLEHLGSDLVSIVGEIARERFFS